MLPNDNANTEWTHYLNVPSVQMLGGKYSYCSCVYGKALFVEKEDRLRKTDMMEFRV